MERVSREKKSRRASGPSHQFSTRNNLWASKIKAQHMIEPKEAKVCCTMHACMHGTEIERESTVEGRCILSRAIAIASIPHK